MAVIREADLIDSVAEALQYISYFHPPDFIRAMAAAWAREESPGARNAMAQILVNSRMCAIGRRPICQDTGTANVFLSIGVGARLDLSRPLQEVIDDAVRRAYRLDTNPLRASVVIDPLGARANSGDNTPAMLSVEMVGGDSVSVHVSAKGGGSENKAKFAVLNPSASIADWVVSTVETLGAGWCPPGILGIGVGGSSDRAMLLAKQVLNDPIDMPELRRRGPRDRTETLRLEIHDRVNALGIGAQGLGGLTTVLDVKIRSFPTHAASLPVGLIPNCAATRHVHFTLDGSGPATFAPPDLTDWPEILLDRASAHARRIDLDTLDDATIAALTPGESLLLSGTLFTGRDAAHRRMAQMLDAGEPLPVDRPARPCDLLCRAGGCGRRRGDRPRRPHHRNPHGPLHRADPRGHRPAPDDRQGRARAGGDRRHCAARDSLSDRGRRCCLSRLEGDPRSRAGGLPRPRHGSDLSAPRRGHAGDCRRRQPRQLDPCGRPRALATESGRSAAGMIPPPGACFASVRTPRCSFRLPGGETAGGAAVTRRPDQAPAPPRSTQRKPMWLVPVSIICGWRAAGR